MKQQKGMIEMLRRHFIAAKAKYRCEWKCTGCGRMNRERGEVAAADRVAVNQFTGSLYDEVGLSGELAQEKARRRLFALQRDVNDGYWLQGLRVSGVCRKCGRRQFWAPGLRHAWAVMAAAACFGIFAGVIGFPESGEAWLGYAAAAAASAFLTEAAALLLTRWQLNRQADPECAPFLEEIPPED